MREDLRDRLTKLLSEETLEKNVHYEINRARRYRHPLTFLLIEPKVEENRDALLYSILKKIAIFIQTNTRYVDTSVRMGRQILIILVETDRKGAQVVKDKLQSLLENKPFAIEEEAFPVSVKLLFALASYPHDGETIPALLKALHAQIDRQLQSLG